MLDVLAPARAMTLLAAASDGDLHLAYRRGALEHDAPVFAGPLRIGEEVLKFAQTIDAAWAVASVFGLPPTTEVDLAELEREHARMSMLRVPFTVGQRTDAEVSITLDRHATSEPGKPVAILLNPSTRIGSQILAGVLAVRGDPTWTEVEEGRMTVKDPQPRLMAKRVLTVREWQRFDPSKLFDEASRVLEQDGVGTVFRPDHPGPKKAKNAAHKSRPKVSSTRGPRRRRTHNRRRSS